VLIIGRETIQTDSATFMPQKPNTCAGRRRTDGEWSTGGLERTAAGGLAVVRDHGSAERSSVGAIEGVVVPQAEAGAARRAPPGARYRRAPAGGRQVQAWRVVDEQEDSDDRGFERDDEGAAQIPQRVAVQKVREHHHGDPAEQRAEGPDARTGEEPAEERDAEVRDAEETPEEARARDDALRGTECPSPGEDLFPPPAQFREQVPVQKEDDAEDEEEECDPEQADVIRRARSGDIRRPRRDRARPDRWGCRVCGRGRRRGRGRTLRGRGG